MRKFLLLYSRGAKAVGGVGVMSSSTSNSSNRELEVEVPHTTLSEFVDLSVKYAGNTIYNW